MLPEKTTQSGFTRPSTPTMVFICQGSELPLFIFAPVFSSGVCTPVMTDEAGIGTERKAKFLHPFIPNQRTSTACTFYYLGTIRVSKQEGLMFSLTKLLVHRVIIEGCGGERSNN